MPPMRASAFALLLLAAAPCFAGDTRIERTVDWEAERPGQRPERTNRRETLWVGEGRVRCDDRVGRETWIVRGDLKVIWRIDHALRTYTETTYEEAAKGRAAAAADVKAALARVAGSGDEAGLQRFVEALEPAEAEGALTESGDGGMVAGKATKAVAFEAKGAPPVKGKLAAGSDRLAKVLGEAGVLAPAVAAALAKSKGILLAGSWTLVFADAVVRETFETTKVEEAAAPEGTYDLPAGYRKVAGPAMGRAPRGELAPPGGFEGDAPGTEPEPGEGPAGEEAGKDE